MADKNPVIFISWANYHSHTQQLGVALNADIYYISNLINSRGIIWKIFFLFDYLSKTIRSIKIINKQKPRVVFVQNPPSIAVVVVVFICLLKKIKVVSDSHNGAFEKPWISFPFHRWALRKADIVIVHNQEIFKELTVAGKFQSVPFRILNSRLTDFSLIKKQPQETSFFLVISTFHGDEPMELLLKGIKLFIDNNASEEIRFKITGNYNKAPALYKEYSTEKNIEFLGFINQKHYNHLIVNSFGVISLSTRDNVQQFSLIESISANVPFISTDNKTNRSLFGNKMILTQNSPGDIAECIAAFISKRDTLQTNINEIKNELNKKWSENFIKIKKELGLSADV